MSAAMSSALPDRPAEATASPDVRAFLYDVQRRKDASTGTVATGHADARKNLLDLNVLVCVDVSGSISPAQFRAFMQQIDLIKGLSRVRVVEIDTQVVAMYDYFKVPQGRVMRLGGGGGTAFAPAFALARQVQPDAILFMTDGGVFDSVRDPKIPTGWVLTRGGHAPYDFGTVVRELP